MSGICTTSAVTAVLSAVAAAGWLRARHWRRSYLAAVAMMPALHLTPPPAKTPHQRGAETRKRRDIAMMRECRMAMEQAMARDGKQQ